MSDKSTVKSNLDIPDMELNLKIKLNTMRQVSLMCGGNSMKLRGIEKVKLITMVRIFGYVELTLQGFGYRSWNLTVKDGEVEKMWVEEGKNQRSG